MEHRLLNRKIKVKIRLRFNPTTTSYFFWDLSLKFNVTCRCILIPKHGSEIVITHITHETFHYYFLLLTLPKEALNKKLLKWNAIFVPNITKRYPLEN